METEKITITVPKGTEVEIKKEEDNTKKDESKGNDLVPMNEGK